MLKRDITAVALFGAVFLFSIVMIVFQNLPSEKIQITGQATTGTTVSNVTISKYLSISMSPNLTAGILFGTVNTLPATNINATHNDDAPDSNTSMYLNVSTDSNTAVDFCIKANADLEDISGGNTLGVGNESYANSTSQTPSLNDEVSLTTGYVFAGNTSTGGEVYYRFWLDVPAGTPSGSYNNTITFKGVEANGGSGC